LRLGHDSVGATSAPSDAQTLKVVALMVMRHADAFSLDPDAFAGHSLRSRFLTSAAEAGPMCCG